MVFFRLFKQRLLLVPKILNQSVTLELWPCQQVKKLIVALRSWTRPRSMARSSPWRRWTDSLNLSYCFVVWWNVVWVLFTTYIICGCLSLSSLTPIMFCARNFPLSTSGILALRKCFHLFDLPIKGSMNFIPCVLYRSLVPHNNPQLFSHLVVKVFSFIIS